MCVPTQPADPLGWQSIVAGGERALEQFEQVDGVGLDRLRGRGQARRNCCTGLVELGHLAPEVLHLGARQHDGSDSRRSTSR